MNHVGRPGPGRGFYGTLGVVVAVVLLAFPGCFDWFGCGALGTGKEWFQPEIFDEFPPEGSMRGEFDIGYNRNSDGKVIRKTAGTKDFDHSVSAHDNGLVRWTLSGDKELSDSATNEKLETAFADLGLPRPALEDRDFKWGTGGC